MNTSKIIVLCRPHAIEIDTGDINHYENISWPKPHIHKTYYRRYNNRKNIDELLGNYLKQKEELSVQFPDHHEGLPVQSLEKNEEFPVQYLEDHEESPKQSPDFVTIDVVIASITLKEIHRHVDGGHWKEITDIEI